MNFKEILDFLHTPFVDKKLIFLDWFSFSHLIFGFVTIFILLEVIGSFPVSIVLSFIVLVAWELFEVYASNSNKFFIRPDKLANSMWDLIIGGIGIAAFLFINKVY